MATAPVKRGRGRPPKNLCAPSSSSQSSEQPKHVVPQSLLSGDAPLPLLYSSVRLCTSNTPSMVSKFKKQSATLTTKKALKSSVICPICEEAVVDSSSKSIGHDTIFCEGTCKAWLHGGCAGMSKAAFVEVYM